MVLHQVVELVTMRCAKLEESRQLRRDFVASVTKQSDWLDNRVKAADKLDTVRLLASDVEKQADKCKVGSVCVCVCVLVYVCVRVCMYVCVCVCV